MRRKWNLWQVLVLPGVLRISKGRESLVVQGPESPEPAMNKCTDRAKGAMMVHAFKFIGYAWAPNGKWVYVVLAAQLQSWRETGALEYWVDSI